MDLSLPAHYVRGVRIHLRADAAAQRCKKLDEMTVYKDRLDSYRQSRCRIRRYGGAVSTNVYSMQQSLKRKECRLLSPKSSVSHSCKEEPRDRCLRGISVEPIQFGGGSQGS